jgi:hypothetical protein
VKLLSLQMTVFTYSRNSGNKKERLCTLPKIRNHVAQLKESYNIKGLLPAPLICHTKNIIALAATANAVPIYLSLYDYNNSNFFSGNKRKIKIALPFHQVEGIATKMAYTI